MGSIANVRKSKGGTRNGVEKMFSPFFTPHSQFLILSMNDEIRARLDAQDTELAAIRQSVEKIRKQLFWKSVFGTVLFLLPLIGLAALIPWLLDTLTSTLPLIPELQ